MGIIETLYTFYKTPKCNSHLQKWICKLSPDTKKKKNKLKELCPTRWIESYESVMVFIELFKSLISSLEEITEDWTDKNTTVNASLLLSSIKKHEFLIALFSMQALYSFTLPLSRVLQSLNIDLVAAVDMVKLIIKKLRKIRNNVDLEFNKIFNSALNLLQDIYDTNYVIPLPRTAKR